ncbi:MAG: rhomboid family intramembrane serine protease [Kiritimatiellales bacterium]|nr:rhomboid family intramembrane serine protease [Kiritimatiellales bacterium]
MRTATQAAYGNPNGMTFGVQLLIILNVATYIIEYFFHFPLSYFGALQANWWTTFSVWQLITYQFIHQGFWHLFSNMLGLYFLGPDVERTLGTNRFFSLYFLSGILGGLGWSLLSPYGFCVGASGAIFGVLGAYAALYPKRELVLILFPFMPIKAWVFVLLIGAYEFMHTLAVGSGSHVANAAHLGGGIAGYIYATITGRPDILHKLNQKLGPKEKPPVNRAEIDRILDKAAQHGMHTLTKTERDTLKRAGRQ